ncbi:cytochrome c [Thioclava sp. JE_KL1]|uniref:cytochrome c n=1 Tax=Thioclava sp. JE_KL1 TaxID=2651187 RepID=UPI00128C179F|nr:cytochrome c [Thioclava sp. JE_KL1]MPQ92556.1 c-type cytochrome [Thioclava sp. JE_KL1]
MRVLILATAAFAAMSPLAANAQSSSDASGGDLVKRGKYLAIAGDCSSCHAENFSGGEKIESPIGAIYAPNITPDEKTGIGDMTEAEFEGALRRGKSDTWLYPAMPYTHYTGLTDADVKALWAYFKQVKPVENDVPETDLGFPFVRPAMMGWNTLFLDKGQPPGAVDVSGDQLQRGRYLVETLEHCSSCHSPRGTLMQEDTSKHLAGGMLNGWYAPNLTPSDKGGLGDWSEADIVAYLSKGRNAHAVAGGEMGLVVSRSTSKLSSDDLTAIAKYLKAVKPVDTQPEASGPDGQATLDLAALEAPNGDWKSVVGHDTTDGATLYQGACATCHGMNGQGTAAPALSKISDVRSANAANVVQVIAHGINMPNDARHVAMPGFQRTMNDAQIASVASYVRTNFGGVDGEVTKGSVANILSGKQQVSWIIANAAQLAWAAIAVAVLLVLALIGWAVMRTRRRA